ncbi:Ig kappa chain V-III region VG, partial [Heterocephalus glaber]
MWAKVPLLWMLLLLVPGYTGEVVVIQSTASLTVSPGQKATISCRASQSVNAYGIGLMHSYQQKPGQLPKLMIYHTSNPEPGVLTRISSRFSGSGSGMDSSLAITSLEPKDFAGFYCQHSSSYP